MADNTKIEWTEATWNPITGCTVHSAGCTNCYAMKLAGTRLQHHPSRVGLTKPSKAGPVWTGEVRFNEEWLTQPLQWKRPRMIFVCAHADLFHENVPDEWIDCIFAVMALCPQHTFQVLTKRSARMREYLDNACGRIADQVMILRRCDLAKKRGMGISAIGPLPHIAPGALWWPLPNVWLGVSVENQAAADERIPDLLATPAAVRWISAEPLLGPVDLRGFMWPVCKSMPGRFETWDAAEAAGELTYKRQALVSAHATFIDWVVAGGESGTGARPMHPDWARSLRDQCAAAGTPFFFKQWGNWLPCYHIRDQEHPYNWKPQAQDGSARVFEFRPDQGQSTIIPQEPTTRSPDDQFFWWFSKKAAGRLLDGVEHNGMPT